MILKKNFARFYFQILFCFATINQQKEFVGEMNPLMIGLISSYKLRILKHKVD